MNSHLFKKICFKDFPVTSGIEVLKDLIIQSRPNEWVSDYPNSQDLHELLTLEEVKAQTMVWVDDSGEAKAFCIVDPYNNLLFDCTEISYFSSLFKKAVQFGNTVLNEKYNGGQEVPTLDVSCRGNDNRRIACLKTEEFKRDIFESISFKRSLKITLQPMPLINGFIIRPLAGEQEINTYVDLHQVAFGTNQMTLALRRSIMTTPEYDAQLDLVVQSPDGNLVAFCVCQINESDNMATKEKSGWTDPIGVHPDFRKMGLAKALMTKGMIKLKERGMDYARLGTRSDNIAMIQLAKAMGFLKSAANCGSHEK